MKTVKFFAFLFFLQALFCAFPSKAPCPWEWTPKTKKFINLKDKVKETPKEQFDFACSFEQGKNQKRAIHEYRKLLKEYPTSSLAVYAQIAIGDCFQKDHDYYAAFKEYQKVLENYPAYGRIFEIIEHQYKIGNLFLTGGKRRLWRLNVVPATDKAIEIFQQVIANAPFSEFAPRSQFLIGEAYFKMKKYSEAVAEYQKLIADYPQCEYVDDARFQIGLSAYRLSRGPSYDQQATDLALKTLGAFINEYPESKKVKEGKKMIKELESRKAQGTFDIAEYYMKQKNYKSAEIYYNDLIKIYPKSALAEQAGKRLAEILTMSTTQQE